MTDLLDRMGRKGAMTAHGCRATFRTWAQEQTNFPREIAEMALGHVVGTEVERAYARLGPARQALGDHGRFGRDSPRHARSPARSSRSTGAPKVRPDEIPMWVPTAVAKLATASLERFEHQRANTNAPEPEKSDR